MPARACTVCAQVSKVAMMQQDFFLSSLTFKFSLWGPQPRVKMPEGPWSFLSSQGIKAMVVMVV